MPILNSSTEGPKEKSSLPRNLVGIAVFFLLFILIAWGISRVVEYRRARVDERMVQTARTDGPQIEISHVYFNTGENFLGDRVRYLNGQITNHSDRPLELIELTFVFVDAMGQTVLRETKRPIDEHKAALKSGEFREFAVGFEHLPADWNRQHPSIQITRLKFVE